MDFETAFEFEEIELTREQVMGIYRDTATACLWCSKWGQRVAVGSWGIRRGLSGFKLPAVPNPISPGAAVILHSGKLSGWDWVDLEHSLALIWGTRRELVQYYLLGERSTSVRKWKYKHEGFAFYQMGDRVARHLDNGLWRADK